MSCASPSLTHAGSPWWMEHVGGIARREPLVVLKIERVETHKFHERRLGWDGGLNGFNRHGLRLDTERGAAAAEVGFQLFDLLFKAVDGRSVLPRIGGTRPPQHERCQACTGRGQLRRGALDPGDRACGASWRCSPSWHRVHDLCVAAPWYKARRRATGSSGADSTCREMVASWFATARVARYSSFWRSEPVARFKAMLCSLTVLARAL